MFIVYDFIILIFTLIFLPIYLFKGKFHKGFMARLGILPKVLSLDRPIWVHAVSLGEAISIRGLIAELRKVYPSKKFVISTVTPTGNKIAITLAREGDLVTYLPLDFSFIVAKVINKINPGLFIITETEIWPNLINFLHKKHVPIVTVNARISDASFKKYLSVKFMIKPVLNKISLFCAQSNSDAQKLKDLGVNVDKVKVTGNMKFDSIIATKADGHRERLGLTPEESLFVAGSTHPGEEEIILRAYSSLKNKFLGLRLLIAPRHPQRADNLAGLIRKFGFEPVFISSLRQHNGEITRQHNIFILDTVGELAGFYAAAGIVFVGGSLVKRGGHNILEPASLGLPVIFGPHVFNFRDIIEAFLKDSAAVMVSSQQELERTIAELLKNNPKFVQLTQNAKEVISKNKGATKRNVELIKSIYR